MPRVIFFILPDQVFEARDYYACVLAEKAVRQQQQVLIQTRDADHSQHMDALLWSFRDNSFVPHLRLDAATPNDATAAVHITSGDTPDKRCNKRPITLINLGEQAPTQFEHYALLYQIVCANEASRQSSRELFRFYRAHGFAPQHQTIRQRVLSQY
jgi:DNA polymerase-3 subunit chi